MTDYRNIRFRLDNLGLDLLHTADNIDPGKYTRLQNVFSQRDGEMSTRLGTSPFLSVSPGSPIHSMRRIGDSTLVLGSSDDLYVNAALVSSGWSGDPLSLVRFRPSNSSDQWMYIGDSAKMRQVKADGTKFLWGIVRPSVAPTLTVN